MAIYLVKARPDESRLGDLRALLDRGDIRTLKPFGKTLAESLQGAKRDGEGWAWWEEEDYCSPPLAAERAAVLDRYFDGIEVEPVEGHGAGWRRIESLPRLWDDRRPSST